MISRVFVSCQLEIKEMNSFSVCRFLWLSFLLPPLKNPGRQTRAKMHSAAKYGVFHPHNGEAQRAAGLLCCGWLVLCWCTCTFWLSDFCHWFLFVQNASTLCHGKQRARGRNLVQLTRLRFSCCKHSATILLLSFFKTYIYCGSWGCIIQTAWKLHFEWKGIERATWLKWAVLYDMPNGYQLLLYNEWRMSFARLIRLLRLIWAIS